MVVLKGSGIGGGLAILGRVRNVVLFQPRRDGVYSAVRNIKILIILPALGLNSRAAMQIKNICANRDIWMGVS